ETYDRARARGLMHLCEVLLASGATELYSSVAEGPVIRSQQRVARARRAGREPASDDHGDRRMWRCKRPDEPIPTSRCGLVPLVCRLMAGRPPRRVLVAVALVAGCTLGFQVVFTRVLSAVLAYHFAFLAISLGLLGTGTGALAVYLLPGWFARLPLTRMLAGWCSLFAASLIALPFAFVHFNFSTGADKSSQHFAESIPFFLNVAGVCVLAALPSLAAGVVIALTITGYTRWIGRVYAADLVGAGLGALLVVPLLSIVDAPTLLVGVGVAAAVAAVLFAGTAIRERVLGLGSVALGACLIVVSLATSVLFLPPGYNVGSDAGQVAERWNPL